MEGKAQAERGAASPDERTAVNSPATSIRERSKTRSSEPEFHHRGAEWGHRSALEQWRPFRGMLHDVQVRLPFYVSDWTVGFQPRNFPRCVASAIKMYGVNLFPAIAYTLDMAHRTNGAYGINQTILASAIAAIASPIFAVQPLTVVGVTGLINLFNYTNYDIVTPYGIDFLQFQAWALIWSAITHWLIAIFNICDYVRYMTDTTTETFGFYVGVIYIQKGIELLIYEFEDNTLVGGWFAVVIAMLFALFNYHLERVTTMPFGPFWFRKALKDYNFLLCVIFFTGFVHIPGSIRSAGLQLLPVAAAFQPSDGRPWVIRFWELDVKWIFVALPFGILLTDLFWIDHNVSSIMAQARNFPVKRPAGFHWDFALLGIIVFVCGVLGLPAPNGLVPQAPFNTESLCITKHVPVDMPDREGVVEVEDLVAMGHTVEHKQHHKVAIVRVVEQRISHLGFGLMTLGTLSGPLLHALGWMPRAMFAGIFISVGWGSVEGNGIVHKTLYLLRDRKMIPPDHHLNQVSRATIVKYLSIQWFVFASTVAISQLIAAIGFPVIFTVLVAFRKIFGPRIFTAHELRILDAPTANSKSVMVSIGGALERVTGEGVAVAADNGIEGTLHDNDGNEKAPSNEPLSRPAAVKRQSDVEHHTNGSRSLKRRNTTSKSSA